MERCGSDVLPHLKGGDPMKSLRTIPLALLLLCAYAQATAAAGRAPALHSWSEKLEKKRFVVLESFGGAAVLDNETGLVWEQSPSSETFTWLEAQIHCNTLGKGDRHGWRLPTYQDLASLIDRTQISPALPVGHPFSNVQLDIYWSATTFGGDTSDAWVVSPAGNVNYGWFDKATERHAWCVRGGQGVDPQ